MKFTFEVDGREVTFSCDELESIVKEKFATKILVKGCKTPTEGKAFSINPMAIDRSLFSEKKEDKNQERTRQLILEAFSKVDANPERYAKPFKTMMPKKDWEVKTVKELEWLANSLGNHLADWVEQAMEWAQRIANGETWKTVCNEPDTASWYRLVKWKADYYHLIGGSCMLCSTQISASDIYVDSAFYPYHDLDSTVPLVVF